MTNVVLYARFSSDNQREESIDAQLRAGREYCKRKEYCIIREYRDEAFTATNDNRPGYQQMLADSKRGLFDVVVFHKIDRNARNEFDYYFNKMQLKKVGVRIEYSAQSIDDSPEGALTESVMVGVSAYYSRNLSKEVKKGMKENAFKGYFNGGTPPLGYQIKDKKYIIDEHEAAAVRLIFDMYLKGYGYGDIMKELNRQGHKTKRGRTFGKNSLYDILTNARYAGVYTFGKNKNTTLTGGKRNQHCAPPKDLIVVEDMIPVIIKKSDFAKAMEKMEFNKQRRAAYKAKHNYLLSGIVFCADCGAAMQGKTTGNKDRLHQYYRCGVQDRKGSAACPNTSVNLVDIENVVIGQIEKILFSPAAIEQLTEKLSTAYINRKSTITTEKAALNKQKIKIKRRMDMLYTQIEEGLVDEYDLERLKKVKEEMNAVREKLADLDSRPHLDLTREQVKAVIDNYHDAIKTKSAENLRALIQNFINKIVISREEIMIEFKINFGTYGAGEGNRTLVSCLGSKRSAIELRPRSSF